MDRVKLEGEKERVAVVCYRICRDFLCSVRVSGFQKGLEAEVVDSSVYGRGDLCEESLCVCFLLLCREMRHFCVMIFVSAACVCFEGGAQLTMAMIACGSRGPKWARETSRLTNGKTSSLSLVFWCYSLVLLSGWFVQVAVCV